nr:unnamed protein product [Callosobruchus analis]
MVQNVRFLCVPSHTGIPCNEEADKVASNVTSPLNNTTHGDLKVCACVALYKCGGLAKKAAFQESVNMKLYIESNIKILLKVIRIQRYIGRLRKIKNEQYQMQILQCARETQKTRNSVQWFCAKFVHGDCVNIVGQRLDAIRIDGVTWTCEECRATSSTVGAASSVAAMRSSMGAIRLHTPSDTNKNPSKDFQGFVKDMEDQLRLVREQQTSLLEFVSFCSHKISDFEQKVIKKVKNLTDEHKKLKTDVQILQDKVDDLELLSRSQNIEIQGIQEKENEHLFTVLKKIGSYINYQIRSDTIEYVHRVQLNKNSKSRVRNIIVRFTSTKEKRRNEETKQRRNEDQKNEGAKERGNEGTKKRLNEGAKERNNEDTQERRNEDTKERRNE